MMNYTFLSATILLLLITDPVGNIPIFANALKHVPFKRRPWVILREIMIEELEGDEAGKIAAFAVESLGFLKE